MSLIAWFTTAEQKVGSFISGVFGTIKGDAATVVQVVETGATIADNLVNGLKNWLATPAGQTVEDVITAIPGIGPYATDVLNFLPTLMVDLGWAQAEFTKSPQQVVVDGITAAVNAATPNIKSTNLSVLQAHVNTYLTTLAGAPVPIQASLTQANPVHTANAAVQTTEGAAV